MGEITLNQIRDFALWLIAFFTALYTVVKAVQKAIEKGFKPINDKIDSVDKNSTKNYLVQQIGEIDRNGYIDGAAKVRFYEQLQHYEKDLDGNSYIKDEVERLKKEGKL
ncbi:MAG: hypothetical protein IJF87_08800 [Erysipelotrichaceae bacterium]|nr:hypothetical protein [Erysipelotrichaceae bacterium]